MSSAEIARSDHQLLRQRCAELPDGITPLWFIIQPLKVRQKRLDISYSEAEAQFWGLTVINADQALAELADSGSTLVRRVEPAQKTALVRNNLNGAVRNLLLSDPEIVCVGFAHGIISNMAELYNNLPPLASFRQRVLGVIISGSQANEIKTTSLLSPLPEIAYRTPMRIAYDDVFDTGAALAAFVEDLRSQTLNIKPDYEFVSSLTETFGQPYENYKELYDKLIDRMQETAVVVAIAFYKNRPFVERLTQRLMQTLKANPRSRWSRYQMNLLSRHLQYRQDEWLMGDGLDTGIAGQKILQCLPQEIKTHPQAQPLLKHLADSRIRVGSTIKGLICLQNSQIEELTAWVAHQVSQKLTLYIKRPLNLAQS